MDTMRRGLTRLVGITGAMTLACVVVAPAAHAEDLPPAPVMPGFENVVIGPMPLSGPATPAPTAVPSFQTAPAVVPPVEQGTVTAVAKKTVKAKRVATVKVRTCAKKSVTVRGKKVTRTVCTVKTVAKKGARIAR